MASRTFLRSVAIAAILAIAAPALAEPTAVEKETARTLMQEGRDLRDRKDLKGALQRFQAADQLMVVPTTGFEVASTQVALGLLVEARETLGRVHRLPVQAKEPPPFREARQKAEQLDESLDARIPALTIVVKGGVGAKLTVDDIPVSAALVGLPLRVNPGRHMIIANLPTARGETEIAIAEGEKKEAAITLVQKIGSDSPPPEDSTDAAPKSSRGSYVPAILAFGLAGAGAVVGGITGAMTFAKQSDLAKACPNHTCGPGQYGDVDSANALAMVSTISFIAAGSTAVLGVVLFFVAKPSSKPTSAAKVQPWIGVSSAGISGAF